MPTLTHLEFDHEGHSYLIELSVDDSAMMQNVLTFDVTATRKEEDAPELALAARVEIHPLESMIIIFVNNKEVSRLSIFDNSEYYLEALIDNIPQIFLVDPVIGCALKAGVSSVVGRAVECAHALEDNGAWKNITTYFGCMSSKFTDISKKTLYRTFRCIFTGV